MLLVRSRVAFVTSLRVIICVRRSATICFISFAIFADVVVNELPICWKFCELDFALSIVSEIRVAVFVELLSIALLVIVNLSLSWLDKPKTFFLFSAIFPFIASILDRTRSAFCESFSLSFSIDISPRREWVDTALATDSRLSI